MAIIEIKNLHFSYEEGSSVLNGIDLQVQEGQFVVLAGPSGCGKSTLLKLLKPELAPEGQLEGEILYNEVAITAHAANVTAAEIGFVMQNPDSQIVTDKVWHELAFGLENIGLDSQTIRRRVAEMANYFGIHKWFHDSTVQLSGGQKQLLNLASVLVMQPKVLLLDEPTAQLDPIAAAEFMHTLRKLHQELGLTIIMIEHRLEEVLAIADQVVLLDNGRILYDGLPVNLPKYLPKSHPMQKALPTPTKVFLEMDVDNVPLTVRQGQQLLKEKIQNRSTLKDTEYVKSECVLQAENVSFRYKKDGRMILNNFSYLLYKGEIASIVGGNGSGKTTAMQVLAGLYEAQKGEVRLYGKRLKKYKREALYQQIFAVMPQDPKLLFVEKTVQGELEEMAKQFQISDERITAIVQELQLQHLLERHPYDLSGGEQQKVAFAKMLLRNPQILLLDEPTKGLDAHAKEQLGKRLKKLQATGMTILIVTHDLEFAATYSNRCSMFFDGGIVSEGTPRTFFSGNHFYTTAAYRMSRQVIENAILWEDVVKVCKQISD